MRKLLSQPTAPQYVQGFAAPGIEHSKFTFDSLIRYHLASMVALSDQGLVPKARARRLVGALLEVQRRGVDALEIDPGLEDLQPNVEKAVIGLIGPEDAGDFGIGRARAEFGHVAWHLALREHTLATLKEQLRLNRGLLAVARQHLRTVVPYYTQHMRAEPITFGYYFSAFAEAFLEHTKRTRDAYQRFALSPAGLGHIVPTLRIDRQRLAELMGLGGVVHHSLYGYLNSDLYVDILSAASLTAASISRLCLDFWWWASNELHIIKFGDAWCGGSFIMPHKRNPSWLKPLRFSAMAVKARHDEALELWMHSTPMLLVGSLGIPGLAHEGLKSLRYSCDLLVGALADMTIDAEHGRDVAAQDFTQSSQLVSMIVRNQQASWRQAEHVVGTFVKEALDADRPAASLQFDRLLGIGQEILGRRMELDRDEFARALDIDAIIAQREDCGPAPAAVEKAIASQAQQNDAIARWIAEEESRIATCWKRTEDLARRI
jgi:argininosuccinate lyase